MRSITYVLAVVVTASLFGGGVVRSEAQTLADLARQEEARRKQIKEPAKVITNKDLRSVPAPPPPQGPAAGPAAADTAANADKGGRKDDKAKEVPKDQAYWSGLMKRLQAALDRDQTFAEALQTRINSLTADFSARDDPAQRAVLARERLKVIDELDRLTVTIQADRKAIADFQEEARRAAVPPGWLR